MTPYFHADGITIYHGDCAEIAPTLGRFDLLCTDPPYGIGEARGKNKSRGRTVVDDRPGRGQGRPIFTPSTDYGTSDWDDSPPSDVLIGALRGQATWCCIFGGNYFSLPPSRCWLVWDKINGACDFADAELAWTNYSCAVRLKRYHPTQKPLAVMSWAIGLCPERPSAVLDPFMGSGTTLRACKDLGISAVGIDAEERYCEVAASRLRQGVLTL